MKLNEIHTFVTVARCGSIQAAATRLHMTQSAVTRLVQRLELDLGATLFDRQSKPLALTADGRIALEHGRRVLSTADAMSDALAPMAAPSGLLRIGTAHALAERVAERPLDHLRAHYPDLTLQISVDWATPLIEQLKNGDLDAAIITLLTDGESRTDLPARRLWKEAVRIIGSSNFAPSRFRSLNAMNDVGWAIQPRGCGYRIALTQALERVGAGAPKIIVESFGRDLQLSVVARGLGFGLLPASQLKTIPAKRKIKAFSVPDVHFAVSTWCLRRPEAGRLSRPLDDIERLLKNASTT